MSISVEQIQSYIPKYKASISDVLNVNGASHHESRIYDKIYGLKNIPKEQCKSVFEFLYEPAIKLLSNFDADRKKIKYLVVTHTAKMISPFGVSLPNLLKNYLGLDNAISFGVSITNCAANLMAIKLFETILSSEDEDVKALIIGGDRTFTPYLQTIPRSTVLGEASVAMLLTNRVQRNHLIATAYEIQGKYACGSWLCHALQIDFEKNYNLSLINVINAAVHQSKINLKNLTIIIPHNVNLISWKSCMKSLGIEQDKVYLENVPKLGHCFGADNFINLEELIRHEKLQPGDHYMMVTVGLGAIFVASVFQY